MIEIHNHLNRLREQSLPENFDYNSSDKSASKGSKTSKISKGSRAGAVKSVGAIS